MDIVGAVLAFLKIVGTALGLISQNKDQQTGAELQKGADAEAELAVAQKAVDARDAVKPVVREPDGFWRLPDNQTDPNERDGPGLPSH